MNTFQLFDITDSVYIPTLRGSKIGNPLCAISRKFEAEGKMWDFRDSQSWE